MNTRALTLQPVVNLTYNATLPSLLLAQMIYGDATREPDLTARKRRRQYWWTSGVHATYD